MTLAAGLERRLARLRGGEFDADSIRRLMMFLRENAPEHRVVKEIGHFIAHGKRIQGITFDLLRDVFTVIIFKTKNLKSIDLAILPPTGLEAMRACRRLLPARTLQMRTGMKAGPVNTTLDSLLAAYFYDAAGNAILTRPLTEAESTLGRTLVSYIITKEAFTQQDLFADFRDALNVVGMHTKGDKLPAATISPWLSLIAIDAMHGTTLEWPFWEPSPLSAGIFDGKLGVSAAVVVPQTEKPIRIAVPVFLTDLNPNDWCTPDLQLDFEGAFRAPLRLSAEGKLSALF